MPRYYVRVVLHDALPDEYDALRSLLARQQVSDVIAANDGTLFRLPRGDFVCTLPEPITQVREAIHATVGKVARRHAVLVSQVLSQSGIGLEVVPPERALRL